MSDKETMHTDAFHIRQAVPADLKLILQFIQKLGAYEKLSHEVVATEEKPVSYTHLILISTRKTTTE